MRRWPWIAAAAAAAAAIGLAGSTRVVAHVGSPDVFLDGRAGPYRLFVTVRPPHAIPGVADVEILSADAAVTDITIVPLPLTGVGAKFAPVPDRAARSSADPQIFTGHLWMMTAGAWQVRIEATGSRGSGALSVPVPTLPQATLAMDGQLRVLLFALMALLSAGIVGIVSAAAREAKLEPGVEPDLRARRRGRIAGGVAAGVVVVMALLGNWWWSVEAGAYARYVYRPLAMTPTVGADGDLTLTLRDPGWIASRTLEDFVPDHGHVMHLFIVSPALDRLWHLHPSLQGPGLFDHRLPDMPAGHYELFADLVHATGVPETATVKLDTPAIHGGPLTEDDSAWASVIGGVTREGATLADGGRMVWVRDARPLGTKQLTLFTFRVEDASGRPATDLELYMGMPGHAIFIRRDLRVFAHVHPAGSVPMAAMALGERSLADAAGLIQPTPQIHRHEAGTLPSTVSFPYGFPEAGDYRIFVQVKRQGRVDTAAFDAHVDR
jgi:hypothetical protein